eukprot:XP_024442097.1 uncharacterized protein LOC112324312 isoform X2 [Populus trichocarpa]
MKPRSFIPDFFSFITYKHGVEWVKAMRLRKGFGMDIDWQLFSLSLLLHCFQVVSKEAPSFKPCSSLITLGVNPIYSSSGQVAPSAREGQALLPSEEDLTEGHISPSRLEEETRRGNACCKVPMGIPTFQHTCYHDVACFVSSSYFLSKPLIWYLVIGTVNKRS